MKTVTLQLSEAALNVIAAGLGELPYRVALPVFTELQAQLAAQLSPVATDAPKAE